MTDANYIYTKKRRWCSNFSEKSRKKMC